MSIEPFDRFINRLDPASITKILYRFLTAKEVCRLSRASKRLNVFGNHQELWKNLLAAKIAPTPVPSDLTDYKGRYRQLKTQTNALNRALVTHLEEAEHSSGPPSVTQLVTTLLKSWPDAYRFVFEPSINFNSWSRLDEGTIAAIALREKPLLSLEIGADQPQEYAIIEDRALLALAQKHPELRRLKLKGFCSLTPQGIAKVLAQLPRLRHLSLNNSDLLTHEVAEKIAGLSQLRTLTLRGINRSITEKDLKNIQAQCPRLKTIDLNFLGNDPRSESSKS